MKKPDHQPPPAEPTDNSSENPWAPFQDRLEFDWAYYHYVRLQSSKSDILEGLDLWHAIIVKYSAEHPMAEDIPWRNADDLYATIDEIQTGDAPWKSYQFSYNGPKPFIPPRWMEETYELNTRNALLVLEQQLNTSDFAGQINYTPYKEFDSQGDRLYSNLMSGKWANGQAVSFSAFVDLQSTHNPISTSRTKLRKIPPRMAVCLYLSLLEAIKQPFLWQPVIKNITLFTFHLDLLLILLAVDMGMGCFLSLFFQYQKVSCSTFLTFSCSHRQFTLQPASANASDLNFKGSAANSTTDVLRLCSSPSRCIWKNTKLLDVQMDISVVQFLALALTSLTTRSRFGLLGQFMVGVQSTLYLLFFLLL